MRIATAFLGGLVLVVVVRPANCQEAVSIPKDVLKNFSYFVGDWKSESQVGDLKSEGTWSGRWGKGKNCLIRESSYSENGEMMFGSGVIGWDPAKKRIVEHVFWTKNQSYTILWTLNSAGNLDGELTGFEEGKQFTAEAAVTKNGPNECVYTSKNLAGDEIKVVFRKQPREKGKKAKEKNG